MWLLIAAAVVVVAIGALIFVNNRSQAQVSDPAGDQLSARRVGCAQRQGLAGC